MVRLGQDIIVQQNGAMCQVTLTDEIRPAAAMDRVRSRFPHTLRLAFDSPRSETQPLTYAERLAAAGQFISSFLGRPPGSRVARALAAKAA